MWYAELEMPWTMNRYVEERAEAFRAALGIAGFPADEDTRRLAEYLCPLARVIRSEALERAMTVPCPEGGPHRIYLPHEHGGRVRDRALCEELAHVILDAGLAALLRMEATHRAQRLARVVEMREEWLALQFVHAWFLPSWLMVAHSDRDLHDLSGCSLEMIRERRRHLRGHWLELSGPPAWCAATLYPRIRVYEKEWYLHLVPVDAGAPEIGVRAPAREAIPALERLFLAQLRSLTLSEFLKVRQGDILPPPRLTDVYAAHLLHERPDLQPQWHQEATPPPLSWGEPVHGVRNGYLGK